jgi:hypothetical protein
MSWQEPDETLRLDFVQFPMSLNSYCPQGRNLALSQRLSPLGLIFRFPTPSSGKMLLINFRIS